MTERTEMKDTFEIEDYINFMESRVKGIKWKPHAKLPDPYDKGWYDALRWVLGRFP